MVNIQPDPVQRSALLSWIAGWHPKGAAGQSDTENEQIVDAAVEAVRRGQRPRKARGPTR